MPADALLTALAYADAGIPVFPCTPGDKKPLTPNGFKDATTDRATIKTWWKQHPAANIGSPVRDGELVLDVDPKHAGDATLVTLEKTDGPLPRTRTIQTCSGGSAFSCGPSDFFSVWEKKV